MTRLPLRLVGLTAAILTLTLLAPTVAAQADPQRSLDTANGLLNRGLFDLAIPEYEAFLRDAPTHESADTARYAMAVCHYRLGQFDRAIAALDGLRATSDFPFAAEANLVRADCLLRLGRPAQASRVLQRLLAQQPDHAVAPQAAALLVESLSLEEKHAGVVDLAAQTLERWPNHPARDRIELFLAIALTATGRDAAAGPVLERLVENDADPAITHPALMLLAQNLHARGDLEPAAARYAQVLDRGAPNDRAAALLGLGQIHRQRGDLDRAIEMLEAVRAQPNDPALAAEASLELTLAHFDAGRYPEARRLAAAAADGPDASIHDDAAYWAAKALLRMGQPAEAAQEFDAALSRFSDSLLAPEMAYDLGIAHQRAGDAPAASRTLASFRSRFPEHALVEAALDAEASLALERGAHAEARRLAQQALDREPRDDAAARAMFIIGEAAYLDGDFASATAVFTELLTLEPEGPNAARTRFRLGMSLFREGRHQEARPHLESVTRQQPAPDAFLVGLAALGEMDFEAGAWDSAAVHLERYLASAADAPGSEGARLRLGLVRTRQDQHRDAVVCFETILDSTAEGPIADQARFERARSLLALGDADAARAGLEEVVGGRPTSRFAPHAMRMLGDIALERGEADAAAEWYQRASVGGDSSVADAAGYDEARARLEAGDARRALARLDALLAGRDLSDELRWRAAAARAIALARLDLHDRAISAIEALESEPLDTATRRSLAYERSVALRAIGRDSDAETAFRMLLADTSAHDEITAHALLHSAEIAMDAGRYADAVGPLDELLKSDSPERAPLRESALYRRGVCAHELEDHQGVVQALLGFRDAYPDSGVGPSADLLCAEALLALSRRRDAIERLERASAAGSPEETRRSALLRLGAVLADLQDWSASERAYLGFLEAHPRDNQWFRACFGVGWARENQDNCGGAIEMYERVARDHAGETAARAQFQIGECLFAQGELDRAVRELLRVEILHAYPEWSAAAVYEAGRCFEQMNKIGEAREQYRRVINEFGETRWRAAAAERLDRLQAAALPGHRTESPEPGRKSE